MVPDEKLIAGCLVRDKACWDAFVGRFSKLVYWSIRKTLSDTRYKDRGDICEDIFQDFFEKLLERGTLSKLQSAESLRKFLSVTACHLAIDRVKSVSRLEKRSIALDAGDEAKDGRIPASGDLTVNEGPDPRAEVLAREAEGELAAALNGLSAKERACIELRYLKGLSDKRIAVILGLPVDTVSTIVRRTKEKLRKALAEKGLEA